MNSIGLKGSMNETELEIIHETSGAYLLAEDGLENSPQFWMPKSCFDEDGSLLERCESLLEKKMEGGQ